MTLVRRLIVFSLLLASLFAAFIAGRISVRDRQTTPVAIDTARPTPQIPVLDEPPPLVQNTQIPLNPLPVNVRVEWDPAPPHAIGLPVEGMKKADAQDTFEQSRSNGERKHDATDIAAPVGTPVLAVVDGTIRKLFLSKAGGNTIYLFDKDQQLCYYYAHLERYAEGLREGMQVKRGDRIGTVGMTGNTPAGAPHLHFAIHLLGQDKKWWEGTPINPYPFLVEALQP